MAAWRAPAVLAVALAVPALLIPVMQTAFGAVPADTLGPAATEALFVLLLYGTLAGVAAAGLRLDRRRPALGELAAGGAGLAIGAAGLLLTLLFAWLAGGVRAGTGGALGAVLLLGTVAILVQVAAEELYFRGWLLPALTDAWGEAPGPLVAAVAFAALHVAGGELSPMALVNLFLGGLVFGLLALRTGGLLAPIAAHFAWNWGEIALLGLAPNPGVGPFGALFDLDLVGAATWGGSDDGLNASLGTSAALVALILPLAAWRGRLSPRPRG